VLPDGAFPAKLPNEHARQELENEMRLRGTTALQSPDQFHNKHFGMPIFTVRCTLVQRAVLRSHVVRLSVRPSVTLVDQDHIRLQSRKLIAPSSSPTPLLFVAQRPST